MELVVVALVALIGLLLAIQVTISDRMIGRRDNVCPTCYSHKKSHRYIVRYHVSRWLYNEQLCADEWHDKFKKR